MPAATQCRGFKQSDKARCQRITADASGYCHSHRDQAPCAIPPPAVDECHSSNDERSTAYPTSEIAITVTEDNCSDQQTQTKPKRPSIKSAASQCRGKKADGTQCQRKTNDPSGFCHSHISQAQAWSDLTSVPDGDSDIDPSEGSKKGAAHEKKKNPPKWSRFLEGHTLNATIVKVLDGDSVEIFSCLPPEALGTKEESLPVLFHVRLQSVDSPELRSDVPVVRQRAERAHATLSELLPKDTHAQVLCGSQDKFGRLLAVRISTRECPDVGDELVRRKDAVPYSAGRRMSSKEWKDWIEESNQTTV
uniref:TNase-like domain-containing protein n=1 Tax=Chromera velia CCMP2878 TaxID=1169474 RepID=A0A0G4H5C3_9ALVE|eukprot:Cvel_24739.t1-p1 / transcript=Cvel_24739.t1 / gene=Cvel_24739 / organism=Chromera_velia_CCMP2878 / gene_product=hypothetical protein / transcript_product=hypothetical protein / location=Cvel_scaffold2717:674-1588(-) / protein_length=305 / sequence_SO=supercontig / SO=protein_coding / is_pseudo=false